MNPAHGFVGHLTGGSAMGDELWRLGVTDLVSLVSKREIASREVIESFIVRIRTINPTVNAITVTLTESALAAAREADEALARGEAIGPLHGIPVTVKENVDVAGSATTQGVVGLRHNAPDIDAPHIAQLRRAGAIPLARTNLSDFALRWHTANELHGATRNPWDETRTPGGSSGGDAVALATGMSCLGIGNDYGGSLRIPAQFCGIASIRPTLGRVPMASVLEPKNRPMTPQLMSVQGPMARRVRDLRLALRSMSGPDPRDPWWTPAPFEGPVLPLRVAVWIGGDDVQVDDGVRSAAEALADAGYEVEDCEPPHWREAAELWLGLVSSDTRLVLEVVGGLFGRQGRAWVDLLFDATTDLDKAGYIRGWIRRQDIARDWSLFQAHHPLVLAPVSTRRPFPIGRDIDGHEGRTEVVTSMRPAVVANLLGLPAAAVPVGTADGLPRGVQVIGPRYREDACLDAAQAIEDRIGIVTPIDPL
jgi:amidase